MARWLTRWTSSSERGFETRCHLYESLMTSGMASVTKKLLLYTSNFRNKELLVFLHDAKCLNRSTNQLTSPLRGADCRWLARWPNDLKSSSVLRWLLKECTVLVESIPSLCFIGHCMNICIRRYRLRNCWKITAFSKYIRVCAYSVLLVDDFFKFFFLLKYYLSIGSCWYHDTVCLHLLIGELCWLHNFEQLLWCVHLCWI